MNEGTEGKITVDETATLTKGPQGTAFRKFYGKAFLEDHLGNIRWKGSMKTALASKLARNPKWKGWVFLRTETREKDGQKTILFIYDEMPNPRAKKERAEREPSPEELEADAQAQDDQARAEAEAQAEGEAQARDEALADWEAEQEAQANQGGGEQ